MTNADSAGIRGRPSRVAVYRRFAEALSELSNYGGLPKPYEARNLWDDLWHREAHHSTAIEGNTLILREVERLLDEGRAVGSKEIKDYMEVLGYGDAARWVYEQALTPDQWSHNTVVTVTEIRQIHATAMSKVWEVAPIPTPVPRRAQAIFASMTSTPSQVAWSRRLTRSLLRNSPRG